MQSIYTYMKTEEQVTPDDPVEYKRAINTLRKLANLYFEDGGKYQAFLRNAAVDEGLDDLPDISPIPDKWAEFAADRLAERFLQSTGAEKDETFDTDEVKTAFRAVVRDVLHSKYGRIAGTVIRKYPLMDQIIDTFIGQLLTGGMKKE